jgi:branched-chain amino acid transport system ATP-binding protein
VELRLEEVTTGYHRPLPAITGISMSVRSGEIVAVIGANGAGKTTTLNVISALRRPWSGSIWLDGARIDRWPPDKVLRTGVAQVPEGRRIFPDLTVAENLMLGGYVRHRRAARQALDRVLGLFPVLEGMLARHGGTLSGGEQQMLSIGRALMSDPKLLLLDEPSMGLAPRVVDRIFDYIVSLKAQGIGILIVEQNAARVLEISRFAYVLEDGHVSYDGTSEDCADNPIVRQSYLGV